MRTTSLTQQKGVVLIISLVMLLLLTLIGLTGTQVTSLEEKMAYNTRDNNLAFQAAEAALRGGEAQIETIIALSAFDGDNGLLGESDAQHDYATNATWADINTAGDNSDDDAIEFNTGFAVLASQPRFYIKHLGTSDDSSSGASINIGGYGESTAGSSTSFFTVTARGTGAQDNSQVYLRTHYAKKF